MRILNDLSVVTTNMMMPPSVVRKMPIDNQNFTGMTICLRLYRDSILKDDY
jgi:hypothetical protein